MKGLRKLYDELKPPVCFPTFRTRVQMRGWTPEQACAPVIYESVTFRGRKYRSRHALAHAFGVHHSSLNAQLNRGKSLREAMEHILRRESRLLAHRLQREGFISADEPI